MTIQSDNFQTLSKDKMEFIRRIVTDEQLAKCLLSNSTSFLDYEFSEQEINNLVWNQIFPFCYVVDPAQEAKSYITMSFQYNKSSIWKIGTVTFNLFCHKDIVKTDYGVLRYDFMLQRLQELIHNTKYETWLGKIECIGIRDMLVDDEGKYVGLIAQYKNTEFM